MGNEACTMSLPQVARCEDCLRDLQANVYFEEELRGSRSFKVAKVRYVDFEGFIFLSFPARCDKGITRPRKVMKIYQIYKMDPLIEQARDSLLPFCRKAAGGFNLLPVET